MSLKSLLNQDNFVVLGFIGMRKIPQSRYFRVRVGAGAEPLTQAAQRWFSRLFAHRSARPFKRLAATKRLDKFRSPVCHSDNCRLVPGR
jgi:hypothetical protein